VPGHIEGSQFYAQLVLENLAEGNHTLKVYSQDASGKQMSVSVEFVIDTSYTSPLSVLSPQDITYQTTEIPLTFVCRENRQHDGNFRFAAYVLDGIGSNYIYENSTIADLSIGSHTIIVTVWTAYGFFSKTVYFTVTNQTSTSAPMATIPPTQQPTPTPAFTGSNVIADPMVNYTPALIAFSTIIVMVVLSVAAYIYFRKRS